MNVKHAHNCSTCHTEICEYYTQRNVYYGERSFQSDGSYTIALTPVTFTCHKGCEEYT
jgi:hypothetical protein